MKGICLTFYAYEFQRYQGELIYDWLLEFAKKKGIRGGSAFRGIAGFGRQGNFHEERFFELASDVPVEIKFIIEEQEADQFLNLLKKEQIDLLFTREEITFGHLSQP